MLTWVEINKKAIEHNLKKVRQHIGPDCLLMPVIKSNAYGHGILGVTKICDVSKAVDRICVVNSDEALKLIETKTKKPIMILSFYDLDQKILSKLARKKVIFPVYDLEQAKILNKVGKRVNKKIKVHLKIDIGTSRLGVLPKKVVEFIKKISKLRNLETEGIWSHFSSSEESKQITLEQINTFKSVLAELKNQDLPEPALKHLACSASTILYPESYYNAIRLGLSLYGLHPSKDTKHRLELKPALSWHTKVIQVKNVPTNTKISYGCTYNTARPTKLAVLPVGYWDGYDRSLSNKGQVLIKGRRCPIMGRICMNLIMVDVTAVPGLKTGEKATLIGKQKLQKISAEELANWADTINYEIVDRINPLTPRIYI